MAVLLTKSKYLVGLECLNCLWNMFHAPDSIVERSSADMFKMRDGVLVGDLAKMLFPDGVDIPSDDFSANLKKSRLLLRSRKSLFEAGFKYKNLFSRADILVPVGDELESWDIVEVKSGTSVKDINIHDVSFQKYVFEHCGLRIRNCFLLHLNSEYVRNGELDLNSLFVKEDITKDVDDVFPLVRERIKMMVDAVSSDVSPSAGVFGSRIVSGYHDCFSDGCVVLPENNVFCLYRGGKFSSSLFARGITCIKDIPLDTPLSEKQTIQRLCDVKRKAHINGEKISDFLKTLVYPIYFLDFESFSTAVPMFNGLSPHSHVPFQFSLHVVEKEGVKPTHHEFLYDGKGDPRSDFVSALKKVIGGKGTVLVYNQVFEIGRLRELADFFPEHNGWIENVLSRIVDLLAPFREFHYYNPRQQGSASIKDVLPAITGKGYEDLEIGDGGTASTEFYRVTYEDCSDEERQKVRENLLKYCEKDTLAEVEIVEKLRELCC